MLPATAPEAPMIGDFGARGRKDESVAGPDRAERVKDDVAKMADRILDVVGENPEEDHVASEMPDIGMEEGVGDQGHEFGSRDKLKGSRRRCHRDTPAPVRRSRRTSAPHRRRKSAFLD